MRGKDEETNGFPPVPKTMVANDSVVVNDDHSDESSHFALALALQNQEESSSVFTLESSESESESEIDDHSDGQGSDDDDDDNYIRNYHQFLDSQGQLDFLDDSNSDDEDMEEDDIDPDELSYEELMALGEIVGEESKGGLCAEDISSSLHPSVFHFPPPPPPNHHHSKTTLHDHFVDRCVICQVEYEEGERMVGLIPCDHPYHLDCITKWLQIRKICPICSSEVSSTPRIP